VLNTTPRTWASPEVVTDVELNTEIRDAFTGIQAAWTTYTPAWTSSGTAPALGNGTITGRYMQVGKTISFEIILTLGSTSTVGTLGYFFSLPVTALSGNHIPVGSGNFFDTSAGTDFARTAIRGASGIVGLFDNAGARVGAATPVVPATGDIISVNGTYEAA
jgi:hypothetical protein